jgi:hypothetical protein
VLKNLAGSWPSLNSACFKVQGTAIKYLPLTSDRICKMLNLVFDIMAARKASPADKSSEGRSIPSFAMAN